MVPKSEFHQIYLETWTLVNLKVLIANLTSIFQDFISTCEGTTKSQGITKCKLFFTAF